MIVIGRFVGVYGIRGWLKLESYAEPREKIFDYSPWWLQSGGNWREVSVAEGRPHGKGLVARLDGIEDRDQAAALTGVDIALKREQLPALPEQEYYWSDLIGLRVVTTDGTGLGEVSNLIETGANDVLIVRGERERLVPYIRDRVVTRIDLEGGVIEVDWDADF